MSRVSDSWDNAVAESFTAQAARPLVAALATSVAAQEVKVFVSSPWRSVHSCKSRLRTHAASGLVWVARSLFGGGFTPSNAPL